MAAQRDELVVAVDGRRYFGDNGIVEVEHENGVARYVAGEWVAEAQNQWQKWYPKSRRTSVVRLDKGIQRKMHQRGTETLFLKSRQSKVRALARVKGPPTNSPLAVSEQAQKEVQLQQQRLANKLAADDARGLLMPDDKSDPRIASAFVTGKFAKMKQVIKL